MSRFGQATRPSGAGMQEDLGSIPLRLFSLFKRCGLWTLSLWLCPSQLMKHYLKWLSSLPILMQESFWWWYHNVKYSLPLPLKFRSPPVSLRKQLGVKQVYRITNEPYSLSLSLFFLAMSTLFVYNDNNNEQLWSALSRDVPYALHNTHIIVTENDYY